MRYIKSLVVAVLLASTGCLINTQPTPPSWAVGIRTVPALAGAQVALDIRNGAPRFTCTTDATGVCVLEHVDLVDTTVEIRAEGYAPYVAFLVTSNPLPALRAQSRPIY
jgi:hypothetical protein